MATSILRLNQQKNAFSFLGLFGLLFSTQKCSATEFKVGGADGWSVPSDPNAMHYNQWAQRNRFQIGSSLVFVYPADKDSVLHVTKEDYDNCSTTSPMEKFTDGHTVFKFDHSGPYYFISGVKDNCLKNEKIHVVVLADRMSNSNSTSPPSPAPSDSTAMIPSPAPSSELAPSPPASDQAPPPNGASSIFISLTGSFGALISSYLVLVF